MRPAGFGVLGAGRMGHAIVSSLISRRIFPPANISMADPAAPARRRAAVLGCASTPSALEAARSSKDILLAVKPQKIEEVSAQIRPAVRGKRVISILAGTTSKRLNQLLPGARIIRVMPNTPLLAGSGATVIAQDGVSRTDLRFVVRLFEPMGKVWVVPEKWMNVVTALSGSGPALFCAFLEACIHAGAENGLPATLAEELAIQTMSGTSRLLTGSVPALRLTPESLRVMVTSPGGTTEAALTVFEKRRLRRLVSESIRAAVRRGQFLSR